MELLEAITLFEIFNQLLFQHRSSRDGTIGLDDKEESGGEGRGRRWNIEEGKMAEGNGVSVGT